MNHQDLESQLREAMSQKVFSAGWAAMKAFHDSGGASRDALQLLQKLRRLCEDEATEDFILEMMDIATGWCSAANRIWVE